MSSGPIKLEGFDLPGVSGTTSAPPPSSAFSVDPSSLYGAAFGSAQRDSPFQSYGGSGIGFSDLDLDFDLTLASLAQHGQHTSGANNAFNPSSAGSFVGGGGAHFLGHGGTFEQQFGFRPIDKQQPQQNLPMSSFPGASQPPHVAPTSLPQYFSSATSSAPLAPASIPAFIADPSPHDSRSPSVMSPPPTVDLYGMHSPAPASQESPAEFGSYSSVGDAFAQSQSSERRASSKSRGRASPPETQERGRTAGRSKSASRAASSSVGKAPAARVRSRSARRNATGVAYQAMGTGGAAQQATAAASSSQVPSAIGIPPPTGSPTGSHPLAMSMPAYANGGGAAMPAAWYNSGSALGLGGQPTPELDASGWRPGGEQKGPNSAPSSAPTPGVAKKGKAQLDDVPEDGPAKQAALLTEKRRKRRESHNAVERRRRDNINDRITELASLLPEVLLEQANNGNDDVPGSPGTPLQAILSPAPGSSLPLPSLGTSPSTPTLLAGAHMAQGVGAAAVAASKPNKGIVLAKSVEYIRYLQQLVTLHAQRNSELERMVHDLRSSGSGVPKTSYQPQHHTGSTVSFDSSTGGGGGTSGTGTSDARSPAADLSASMASSHFGDPNFNENFINAANGEFGLDGSGWGALTMPKEEEMDQS